MLNRLFHFNSLEGPFLIEGQSGLFLLIQFIYRNSSINANSVEPDQLLCSAASDRGLHYLPMSLLWDANTNGLR